VLPLENTRIGLKIATGSFAAAVDGFSKDRGIIPDHTVKAKLDDLKTGKDAVLDYALDFIESMHKKADRVFFEVRLMSNIPKGRAAL
jgi:hypothetical protein